ncbi:MAG: hypothetical protein E5X15_10505 [Mesorhizobium sp.]|nr:MAG: hypothetical protein E5X15_10505 [Mesorhizobium sp.]
MSPDYPVGTKYTPIGYKHPRERTVVDILRTYNSKGELVKTRYVATHDFCGRVVREDNVLAATIARGLAAS